ncbi:hypothetical protein D9757_003578 [Collybiopsis confluens]|uniref:adenosine deaminase n=1 Tax=Collybiopsis confluens TaxID=2823264 RepID=A0A8H5MDP6_9AGAR|nr:hypothetical protein D9757_003578 [Collybiopsis confluens]
MSFSSLSDYQTRRQDLILADRALRADHKTGQLSELEAQADKVIRDLRAAEAESIWSREYEGIPHPFPGMEFLTGKRSIIVQTKLFEILGKMPKGGLLHAHVDATVNVAHLLNLATKYPAIHVRASTALNATNIGSVLPELRPLPEDLRSSAGLIALTDSNYVPDTWVQFNKAKESFSPQLGGPEGFDRWLTAAMTINPTEAYVTHNTVTKIWQKFQSTFLVAAPLVRYRPIHKEYCREFILSSIADGISYVEPRINFLKDIVRPFISADARSHVPHREILQDFDEVLNEVKADLKAQGKGDHFIGARIIYTTIRFITPEELEWYLQECIDLKKEFPHLIAGFDLVGDENVLKPLIYYIEPLLKFRKMQEDAGVEIPFIFHGGETLGDGTEADMNLYDAILLGTKRIGHGFSLVKHPKLIEICKERDIAIEVCPISNEILRLTSSMHMHPLPILLNQGVPVALCSDDPSVFGNMGLTFDYFQVLAASEITGLIQLGEMAKDSIKYSTLEQADKEQALSAWQKRWEEFLKYVVTEGPRYL